MSSFEPSAGVVQIPETGEAPPARVLLKERAYADLKKRIVSGEIRPGTFLSERQLAAQMEMSKTPIRAALERLENEGLVRVSPQQGIIVREMSYQEMVDQFEIRKALETFVLRGVAGRLTDAEIEKIEINLAETAASNATREISRVVQLDTEFHMLFCESLGNTEILRVMAQLRDAVHRVIHLITDQEAERILTSYEEHRAIADAAFAGDGEKAAQLLTEHLEYGKQRILSSRRR